jgi:branched-chain amino acid transport system permease protein
VTQFLNYAIPGIPFGCIYALVAMGLVLIFKTSGVFNLAFGAQAYVSAVLFYVAVGEHHWSRLAAFVLCVLVVGPVFGFVLDRALFRHIRTASTTVKLVSGLGLLVGIPPVIEFFWPGNHQQPPSLSPNANHVYHLGSYHVDGNQVIGMAFTLAVVVIFGALFRYTALGLKMRAVVESPRMVQLAGINSDRVSMFAWMISSTVTALAGVLLSPYYPGTVDPNNFTYLLIAASAAAVFAGMSSLPMALLGGLLIGISQQVLTGYLPLNSILAQGLRPSWPFIVLVLLLLFWPPIRRRSKDATDPLASCDPPPPALAASLRGEQLSLLTKISFPFLIVAFLALEHWVVGSQWIFVLTQGVVFATVFLSITILTGMSGQLSLAQAAFAGVGAFATAQFAMHFGIPFIWAMILSGAIAAGSGAVVAIPALRLEGLYLALATLAFGIMAQNILFPQGWMGTNTYVTVPRPQIGSINFSSTGAFFALAIVVCAICGLMVVLVRKGTIGRSLAALRGSEVAATTIGINPTRFKITVFALSAGVAGIGGAMYGSLQGTTSASDPTFSFFFSLVFIVLVLQTGTRTVEGAINAAMGFVLITYIFGTTIGTRHILGATVNFSELPAFFFGFGVLTYAKHPEGIVEYQKARSLRRVQGWLDKLSSKPEEEVAVPAVAGGGSLSPPGELDQGVMAAPARHGGERGDSQEQVTPQPTSTGSDGPPSDAPAVDRPSRSGPT